jgi:hypothetical protein
LLQTAASKNIQKMLDDEALMKRLKIERCEMLHRKTLKIQVLKRKRLDDASLMQRLKIDHMELQRRKRDLSWKAQIWYHKQWMIEKEATKKEEQEVGAAWHLEHGLDGNSLVLVD